MADLNVQIIPKTGPAASLPTEASYGEILVTAENEIYAGGGEGQPLRHLGQGRANELYEVLIEGKLDLNNTTLTLDLNKSPLKLDYN